MEAQLTAASHVAIVSANAFDRGLDTALESRLGIGAEDFIVKPVRHTELLDWLERKLELVWLDSAPPLPPVASLSLLPTSSDVPPRDALLALHALVQLGYFRGIMNKLTDLLAAHPHTAGFIHVMTAMARQFQFEAMLAQLQKVLDDPQIH
jgi:hypothetical protein